jgi:hypothetical protein
MSSVGSTASGISVSLWGVECDFDVAIDKIFKELQEKLNFTHCSTRELGLKEERNDTFLESAELYFNIVDFCDQLSELFKTLKGCSKDALGKCPPELKVEFKAYSDLRKQQRSEAKLAEKREREGKANLEEIKDNE